MLQRFPGLYPIQGEVWKGWLVSRAASNGERKMAEWNRAQIKRYDEGA